MKKNSFRYDTLHRYQEQKQRLSEIETMQQKQRYDEAAAQLENLRLEFRNTVAGFEASLERDPVNAGQCYSAIVKLRKQISDAHQHAVECLEIWTNSADESVREKIKLESLETLRRIDHDHRLSEIARFESAVTNETMLNKWIKNREGTNDG